MIYISYIFLLSTFFVSKWNNSIWIEMNLSTLQYTVFHVILIQSKGYRTNIVWSSQMCKYTILVHKELELETVPANIYPLCERYFIFLIIFHFHLSFFFLIFIFVFIFNHHFSLEKIDLLVISNISLSMIILRCQYFVTDLLWNQIKWHCQHLHFNSTKKFKKNRKK